MKRLLLIPLILWAAPVFAVDELSVRLDSNYKSGTDGFNAASSELWFILGGDAFFIEKSSERVLRDRNLDNYQVANHQLLDLGDYFTTVELFNDMGTRDESDDILIAQISKNFTVSAGSNSVSLNLQRPDRNVTMLDFLFHDADDDGVAGRGDTLGYQVKIDGPTTAGVYTNLLGTGSRLLDMSVRTSHGTVEIGNDPGAQAVRVNIGSLSEFETASINYFAEPDPVVINQGIYAVGGLSFKTDDPDTLKVGDPTVTRVESTSQELCEAQVFLIQDEIGLLLEDPDGDGVPAGRDACPATVPGIPVDASGCSQEAFCNVIDVSAGAGKSSCNNADWRNDESLDDPEDCQARNGRCVAR
jgi:hypothetical protein